MNEQVLCYLEEISLFARNSRKSVRKTEEGFLLTCSVMATTNLSANGSQTQAFQKLACSPTFEEGLPQIFNLSISAP